MPGLPCVICNSTRLDVGPDERLDLFDVVVRKVVLATEVQGS